MLRPTCAASKLLNVLIIVSACIIVFPAISQSQDFIILKLMLNTQDSGDVFIMRDGAGDIWVRKADLARTDLRPGLGTGGIFSGDEYILLKSIGDLSYILDDKRLVLEINAAPSLFNEHAIDLTYRKPYAVQYEMRNSAFVNYGAIYDIKFGGLTLTTEAGLRAGNNLLVSGQNYYKSSNDDRVVRSMTYMSRDNVRASRTYTLGDFSAASGELGSNIIIGGIGIAKNYNTNPGIIRFPSVSLSGEVSYPSNIDVLVNGQLVKRARLTPGRFYLNNIPADIGVGDVKTFITDLTGVRGAVSVPFYYTDKLLKQGFHEYRYGFGYVRKGYGEENFSYGKPVFVSEHSYGFTDKFKAGYMLDASDKVVNFGPSLAFPVYSRGILDAAFSLSTSDFGDGYGSVLGYSFLSNSFNTRLNITYLSSGYRRLSQEEVYNEERPAQIGVTAGLSRKSIGSLSAGYTDIRYPEGGFYRRYVASYNRVLSPKASLFTQAAITTDEDGQYEYEFLLGLFYYFGERMSGEVKYSGDQYRKTAHASLSKGLSLGTGFGFRAAVDNYDDNNNLNSALQYQNNYGTYGLEYRTLEGEDSYAVNASGGIGYIDGTVFFSRPIYDGFAKIKVGEIEGVRVKYYGNVAGTTDGSGEVIIPNIQSYNENMVSIENQDVPVQYSLPYTNKFITVPYRGGSVVKFDVKKLQGFSGRISVREEDKTRAVEFAILQVLLEEETAEGIIGKGGEFYIENLTPGQHTSMVLFEGNECVFDIIVPESEELWINLGDVFCDMAH